MKERNGQVDCHAKNFFRALLLLSHPRQSVGLPDCTFIIGIYFLLYTVVAVLVDTGLIKPLYISVKIQEIGDRGGFFEKMATATSRHFPCLSAMGLPELNKYSDFPFSYNTLHPLKIQFYILIIF